MPSGVQTTVFWTLSIQRLDHFSTHEAEARQKKLLDPILLMRLSCVDEQERLED